MDSDVWPSLIAGGTHFFRRQDRSSSSGDRNEDESKSEDVEAEVDARRDFACPYCDKDHDVASLCAHLEDEHSLEPAKVMACPVCSFKVTGDLVDHIMLQHGRQLRVQRSRKLHRVRASNSQSLSALGRDLKESYLQVLLGATGHKCTSSTPTSELPDLLPSVALNFDRSNIEELAKAVVQNIEDESSNNSAERKRNLSEDKEHRIVLDTERAKFIQHLLFSTLVISTEQDCCGE